MAANDLTLPPSRALTHRFVLEATRQFDTRMSKRMAHFRAYRACYRSRFWEERAPAGVVYNRYTDQSEDGQVKVEVSRAYGWIEGYVGSLFNDRVRVGFKPDPTGRGDHVKGELVANRWLRTKRTAKKIIADMRMALMYDGAAIKLGIDRERLRPEDRVWARVVPWWEVLVDYDVGDVDDQRFVGHVYWIPLAEARKRFPHVDVSGTMRPDALASRQEWAAKKRQSGRTEPGGDVINDEFVRVLEFYNFVDDFYIGEAHPVTGRPNAPGTWSLQYPEAEEDPENPGTLLPPPEDLEPLCMRGRYEVYLPDQKCAQDGPVQVFPMPYEGPDGKPKAPVLPLVFVTDPEYPLHGLSSLERVYDQIRELNYSRTFKSNAVKRNARQVATEKGALTPEAKRLFASGADGAVLEFEQDTAKSRSATTLFAPVMLPPVPADNYRYDEEIERDLAQGGLQAPFTRGEPTKDISATQTNVLNQYSQNEIGQLALSRDLFIEAIVVLYLRVLIQALRGRGADAKIKVTHRRKEYVVTAEDLDADFDIEVKPGPTTPLAQDKERQTFMAIMPVLVKLIGEVRKGDEVAAMMLDDMVEKYELDERYLSDNIRRLDEESAKKLTEKKALEVKPAPGAGSAVPGAGSAPAMPENSIVTPEDERGVPQPQPGPPGPGSGAATPNDGGSGQIVPP